MNVIGHGCRGDFQSPAGEQSSPLHGGCSIYICRGVKLLTTRDIFMKKCALFTFVLVLILLLAACSSSRSQAENIAVQAESIAGEAIRIVDEYLDGSITAVEAFDRMEALPDVDSESIYVPQRSDAIVPNFGHTRARRYYLHAARIEYYISFLSENIFWHAWEEVHGVESEPSRMFLHYRDRLAERAGVN